MTQQLNDEAREGWFGSEAPTLGALPPIEEEDADSTTQGNAAPGRAPRVESTSGPADLPTEREMFARWFRGSAAAVDLAMLLGEMSQVADDIADGDAEDRPAAVARILDMALVALPMNAFWQEYSTWLRPLVSAAIMAWDGSNVWRRSAIRETRIFAYVRREDALQVIREIARIVGGYEHARAVMLEAHSYYHEVQRENFDDWQREQEG